MLNIFKSPKKKQELVEQIQTGLLIKEFSGLNIEIYGTYEDPLFKAKDIGDLLDIKDIKSTLRDFDKDEVHNMHLTDSIGRQQDTNMLTEQGLYKLLFISRKPIAKQFQKWVYEVIKEIRLKGKYDLEEKLKQKELEYLQQLQDKEQELQRYKEKTYEEIEKNGHIYVIKTDAQGAYKVGKTKDTVTKRIKGLQTANVNNIEMILDFETSNPDLLEKVIHYILDRYRCNSNREFFDCNVDYIKNIVEISGNVIDTLKSCYQHISKEELLEKLNKNSIEIEHNSKDDEYELDEQNNNDFYNWLNENITYKEKSILKLQDTIEIYTGKKISTRQLGKYRKEIEKFIKDKFKNIEWEFKQFWIGDIKYKGWQNLEIS